MCAGRPRPWCRLVPELVVAADLSGRQRRIVDAFAIFDLLFFVGCRFGLGEHGLAGERRRTLERCRRRKIKCSLKVRMTVSRSRRRPLLWRGGRFAACAPIVSVDSAAMAATPRLAIAIDQQRIRPLQSRRVAPGGRKVKRFWNDSRGERRG